MTVEALVADIVMRTIREEFAERMGPGGVVTRETRLDEDLGLDDLARLELALVLEDDLGLGLDPDAVGRWRTVGDVLDACLAQLG